jgi:hypothetical protein
MSSLSEGWDTKPADEEWDSIVARAQDTPAPVEHEHQDYELPTDTCVYRRNRSGRWVIVGPVELVVRGETSVVTTRSGKAKTERVLGIGDPFERNGHQFVYGYIGARTSRPPNKQGGSYRSQEAAAQSYRRQYGA